MGLGEIRNFQSPSLPVLKGLSPISVNMDQCGCQI